MLNGSALAPSSEDVYSGSRHAMATQPTHLPLSEILDQALLMGVLDELDYGLMIIDPSSGHLVHANRLALDEFRLHNTLAVVHDRVRARHRDSEALFDPAIVAAAQGRRSLVNLIAEGIEPLPVAVVPMRARGGRPLALLTFGKRQFCEVLSVSFFAKLHALTPAEEGVLKALCRGLRPSQIASESGVAISTIRTQVSSIRQKTGTSSIRELAKKVSTLPPMTSALRSGNAAH